MITQTKHDKQAKLLLKVEGEGIPKLCSPVEQMLKEARRKLKQKGTVKSSMEPQAIL